MSFRRDEGDGAGDRGVVGGGEVDYALVGAASEEKLGIAEGLDEGAFDKGVDIWQNAAQAVVGEDFLVGEAGVAPDVLAGFLLDAACQFGEGFDLIERIAAGKRHIGEFVFLHDVQKLLNGHFSSAHEIPGLRIMAAGTMMGATGTIDRSAETGTVGHGLVSYVQNTDNHKTPPLLPRNSSSAFARFFSI